MSNRFKIASVGDISLGDEYLRYGLGVRAKIEKHSVDYIFAAVADLLSHHDIVFGNLEGVLSAHNYVTKKLSSFVMRGKPQYAKGLKAAGFTVLSLANNHIMQHGRQAVFETRTALQNYGIHTCGLIDEGDIRLSVAGKGVCVGFLAYNNHPQQHFVDAPMYKKFSLQQAYNDIQRAKKDTDLVVVSLHWGDEFCPWPSDAQQIIAHKLIDSGADIILGHHPHVVQGVEVYRNGLICYSLGNFVFDLTWQPETTESFVLSVEYNIPRRKWSHNVIPIRINENFQPAPLHGLERTRALEHMASLSRALRRDGKVCTQRAQEAYETLVRKNTKLERRRSHLYWLSHVHRFPLPIIAQYLRDMVTRRWRKFAAGKGVRIPVLMYHEVTPDATKPVPYSPYAVSLSTFAAHMEYLHHNHYEPLSLEDLQKLECLEDGKLDKARKYVLITFDDGYLGNYKFAYPVLRQSGIKAILFVITDRIGTRNYLDWQQLREMSENGFEVLSHTLSHRDLELLPENTVREELGRSKQILEQTLGKAVDFVSYPQGSYNRQIESIAREVGYRGSFNSDVGFFNPRKRPFSIKRILIMQNHDLECFKKILQRDAFLWTRLKCKSYIKKTLRGLLGIELYGRIWLYFFKSHQTGFENEHPVSVHRESISAGPRSSS